MKTFKRVLAGVVLVLLLAGCMPLGLAMTESERFTAYTSSSATL